MHTIATTARFYSLSILAFLIFTAGAYAQTPDWIQQSNQHANVLVSVMARYQPEAATNFGLAQYDTEVVDLKPGQPERFETDLRQAIVQLQGLQKEARDVRVRQDLSILIRAAREQLERSEVERQHLLPYFDLTEFLYQGFSDLLDKRVPMERRKAALVRLRRYTGDERGYEPIARLAQARFEEQAANKGLQGPWISQVEQDLKNQPLYLEGMREVFAASGLKGWEKNLARLQRQMSEYGTWIRTVVVARTHPSNLLPPEVYAVRLRAFGVDRRPEELIQLGLASFNQTRMELDALSKLYAQQHKLPSNDYRAVIRHLKQAQIPNERLLPLYRERLQAIEEIVRRERIVSLPKRDVVIRLGTEAESAASPAPHVDLPPLIGNTGQSAAFVLPLTNPNAASAAKMDDFSYDAVSWTLAVHEARPGHDLQITRAIENGVSIARTIFAMNSANLEGWALYAEAQMKAHLPLEAQISSLQHRMMRAARAFLDPMLNLGQIDPARAKQILIDDVGLSEPMATQEVDRYTMRAPGQATSYLYGYWRFNEMRARAEMTMGSRFNQLAFHDFIVDQGWLPLDVMEEAVMNEFANANTGSRK